jgi:hypothetical protein
VTSLLTEGLSICACVGEAAQSVINLSKDGLPLIEQSASTGGGGDKALGEAVLLGFLKEKYIPLKLSMYRKPKNVYNANSILKNITYTF